MDNIQWISFAGAMLILAAYAGQTMGKFPAGGFWHGVLNVLGSVLLFWVAWVGQQWGFVFLQCAWAAVGSWGLVKWYVQKRMVP